MTFKISNLRQEYFLAAINRPGRWLAWLKWLLFFVLALLVLGGALLYGCIAASAYTPEATQVTTFAGPVTPARVRQLALNPHDGRLYAGTESSGVFVSEDGGDSWWAASVGLADARIKMLVVGWEDGQVFAGTGSGLFVSQDGGLSWGLVSPRFRYSLVNVLGVDRPQKRLVIEGWLGEILSSADGGLTWDEMPHLPGIHSTMSLLVDDSSGWLYAQIYDSLYVYADGQDHWWSADAGLDVDVIYTLVHDPNSAGLFVGGRPGVFVSQDRGETWEAAGLAEQTVIALAIDTARGRWYAGTLEGVFVSEDQGINWRAASAGLPGSAIEKILVDPASGRIYAAPEFGLYASDDGGQSWSPADSGLTGTAVNTVALDPYSGRLYAGTQAGVLWQATSESKGVYISDDGGRTWRETSMDGLVVDALLVDQASGAIYAGTQDGVYISEDGGREWEFSGAGMESAWVKTLAQEAETGRLYATGIIGGPFILEAGARRWENIPFESHCSLADVFCTDRGYSLDVHVNAALTLWSAYDRGLCWVTMPWLTHRPQASLTPLPDGGAVVLKSWGATISRVNLPPGYRRIPLGVLVLRDWLAEEALPWIQEYWAWLVGLTAVAMLLWVILTYRRLARPYGVPLWAALFTRWRAPERADVTRLEAAWPGWSKLVFDHLARFGEVTPVDLRQIPTPLRSYALDRYIHENRDDQAIKRWRSGLRLTTRERLMRWRAAWRVAVRQMGNTPGLTPRGLAAAAELSEVLAEALALKLGPAYDFESGRSWEAEPAQSGSDLLDRFALIVLANPVFTHGDAQALVNASQVAAPGADLALVIPLQPSTRYVDVHFRVQKVLERASLERGFVLLNQDEVDMLLTSRQPFQSLEARILV